MDQTLGILGAGGFIGSNLVEFLVQETDHRVIGLDIADEKIITPEGERFTFHKADIRHEENLVNEMIRASDVVVDLVAYANPSLYIETPVDVFNLNFVHNLKVVEECVAQGKRIIQFSSAEVYGKASEGDRYYEDTTDSVFGPVDKPRWIYAMGKSLLERVIHGYGMRGDLDYTIIRPFNFIGPRFDYLVPPGSMGGPRVFAHYLSALLSGGPMYLVDGGEVHRAFLHVDDACRAFRILLEEEDAAHNGIFNIGNPESNVTIREFADLMVEIYKELTGHAPACERIEVSGEEFYGKGYEDSDRLPPDVSKLNALGWEPEFDLRDTLRDSIGYYLERQATVPAEA